MMQNSLVVTRLSGGLGNQLFQYAAGRAVALHHQLPLKLDKRFYEYQTLRDYELNVLAIEESLTDERDNQVTDGFWFPRLKRLQSKIIPPPKVRRLQDQQIGFDPRVFDPLERGEVGLLLDGFWQSYKYFASVEGVIRSEFVIKSTPDSTDQAMLNLMNQVDSVCLHIRRGDYVANSATHALHGICDLNYYEKATQLMSQRIKNPHFFVFSDDPCWSKENLKLPFPVTYITHHVGIKNHLDLRLMSGCKNFIIANSSFSWWGAWLSRYDAKIVVAPKEWYAGRDNFSFDLIPDDWLRI